MTVQRGDIKKVVRFQTMADDAHAAAAANQANDKAVRLGEFNGDMPPFNDWVAHVQMCKNATAWSEELKKLNLK
jgi:hypothetical protein